ncbi:MAG: ferritin [Bacteroidetes bacterium GWF2_43_63]|nr:MAG: ferritin [Bacteroidetes bacterium GWE2_42_42]OFY55254.1 MAG: ferritin [Bacteroidetes bacterium GWF2_43_63]HBG70862.1 ferritin [Bacteroidales bacterium]HCB63374.1 ferritin [Bacteroidales bacterium]HCY23077.1 ferritin [Bacteroidales bacterium]
MNKKMEKALNEQINAEMYSSYLYLSMSAYFSDVNMNGFANWMRVQAQEEMAHAMMFFDYVNERGGRVELKSIEKPKKEWKNAIEVFEETLKHEQLVTSLIHKLVDLAIVEKDHATNNMLQWFVKEQVEEEANATALLGEVKMTEGKGPGMFMIDRELKTRVFTPPAITQV